VYFAWNFHEVSRGVFDFASPWRNVSAFLQTAADVGLYVLARPGPYICGEHEFGAFPWWLHTVPGLTLRTNDTAYLAPTLVWWNAILGQLAPHMRPAGGNVLMVRATTSVGSRKSSYCGCGGCGQCPLTISYTPYDHRIVFHHSQVQIENEFGSYGNTGGNPADATYLRILAAAARAALGPAAQLYTTDGGDTGYMTHGALPGEIYATGDGNGERPGCGEAQAATRSPMKWLAAVHAPYR
jgi:hypothetical protein